MASRLEQRIEREIGVNFGRHQDIAFPDFTIKKRVAAKLTYNERNLTPDWLKREEQAYDRRKKGHTSTSNAEEPVQPKKRRALKKNAILVRSS